ncbi:calcineurin B homologous protein 1 [Tetranychus urticae]|uniref:EF-hand domain-containing protein n=1 Tax=Tetranychus urticae TaxID=32264 RepID=T1K8S9_TETUR|nr:calcineurin B homologous protein 1 [Tetranychus urticae]
MGNAQSSCGVHPEEINSLRQKTGLSGSQIERLLWRFNSLDKKQKGYLEYKDLLVPELASNPFGERIIRLLLDESQEERLNFSEFVIALARFSPHRKERISINNKSAKIGFLFNVYDLDRKEKITPEIIIAMLQALQPNLESEEDKAKDYVKKIFNEVDTDKDDNISFQEFMNALKDSDIVQRMSFNFLN